MLNPTRENLAGSSKPGHRAIFNLKRVRSRDPEHGRALCSPARAFRQVRRPKSGRRQFAALPLRVSEAGEVEITLITSRETRR